MNSRVTIFRGGVMNRKRAFFSACAMIVLIGYDIVINAVGFDSHSVHVTVRFSLRNNGYRIDKLSVIFPLPRSSQYQEITNVKHPGGELFRAANSGDQYVRYMIASNFPAVNRERDLALLEYDAVLKNIHRPISEHIDIIPYNRNTIEYRKYTAANLPYIDPAEPRIRAIADTLWRESGENPLEFARRAYEYMAENYMYKNPNTGLHPLAALLDQEGGDCGNLSSIYISILRAKGVPARHLIAYGEGDKYHVWAEFLIEGFGWVPVDVTAKIGNINGNYFGMYSYTDRYVIVNNDPNIVVERQPADRYTVPLLQNFLWWVWGTGDAAKLIPAVNVRYGPVMATTPRQRGIIGDIRISYPDAETAAVEGYDIFTYETLDEQVYFRCALFDKKRMIADTEAKTEPMYVRYEPGSWTGRACWFHYRLDAVRKRSGGAKKIDAEISVIHVRTNKVIGSKRINFPIPTS
jgi:hypothetical protein